METSERKIFVAVGAYRLQAKLAERYYLGVKAKLGKKFAFFDERHKPMLVCVPSLGVLFLVSRAN